jgi:hypothetical protein
MIRKVLLNLLGLVLCVSIFSQNQNDSIQAKKVFGGYKFESKGKILTLGDMLEMMKDNPEAYQYMEKAKSSAGIANVLGFAGGFMIGWPLGTAMGGGKPNWAIAGVGCGLLIVAIPISSSSNKNAMIAVDKFNAKRKGLSYRGQYDLKLGLNPNGLALVLRF